MRTHVYVGPTLTALEVRQLQPDAAIHPPVQHGDLLALGTEPGDRVVLIDGLYHQRAPVRHKEILELIDRGVAVVGCASMGALRAAELVAVGMIGHGEIFEMYHSGEIDADDEVAVTHLTEGELHTTNLPLVNLRVALKHAAAEEMVTADEAEQVLGVARDLYYPERSWRRVQAAWTGAPQVMADLDAYLRRHPDRIDQKRQDALTTLRDLDTVARGGPSPLGEWRNPHVYRWYSEFEPVDDPAAITAEGSARGVISRAEVLRHRQLFDPEFALRWRQFVLAVLPDNPAASLAAVGADADAARPGYLSAGELNLDRAERETRLVVRTYRPPHGAHAVVRSIPAPSGAELSTICAEIRQARELNDAVLWRGRIRLVERLAKRKLAQALRLRWEIDDKDPEGLVLSARDRGFAGLDDALASMRGFFLLEDQRRGGRVVEQWKG